VHRVHSRATPLPRAPIPRRLRLLFNTPGLSQCKCLDLDVEAAVRRVMGVVV